MDTNGEIVASELRDDVSDAWDDADVDGERVEITEIEAEGLSERVAIDEELPLIDRELDVDNVCNAEYDNVLAPETDTIAVTVTTFEDDDNGDSDSFEEVDWLTRTLDETVIEAAIVGVTVDVADKALEIDLRGELLEAAVELKVIELEIVDNSEADNKLVFVVIIE